MALSLLFSFLLWMFDKQPLQYGAVFEQTPQSFVINKAITEASGIASSRVNPGYLWIHEDGGSRPQISLLKNDGTLSKSVLIDQASNIDWEDMALAKGPTASKYYLYVADIGDNGLLRSSYTIYRFEEPALSMNIVKVYDKIRYKYPDGSHNAEAILVDDRSRDIYIITKSDDPSHIYKIPYPQSTTSVNQAVLVGKLNFGGITGGAMSANNQEIILKTYPALNYFVRKNGETIETSLKKAPIHLSYLVEPQGEAVGFASDNSGFYTISEKLFGSSVKLYFYKRK